MSAVSPVIPELNENTVERYSASAVDRYRDAYLVAKANIAIGGIVKAVGYVLGGLFCLVALITFADSSMGSSILGFGILAAAVLVVLTFFIMGTLVCAHGQSLRASLDGAVNSSPFLSNVQKAEAMSLQESYREARVVHLRFPEQQASGSTVQSKGLTVLTVTSEPQGSAVYIDGEWKAGTPAIFDLVEGEYHVAVKCVGHKPYEERVHCTGTPITIEAKLEPRNSAMSYK